MELTSSDNISVFDSLRRRMMMPDPWIFSGPLPASNRWSDRMIDTLRQHWPEYLMEATELGLFMISACAFTVLLYHPASPVAHSFPNEVARRAVMGIAMGSTAIAIIFSPLGKRSGAHFNPSVTLTYFRLGKVKPWDTAFYMVAQFTGGVAGVSVAMLLLGRTVADPAVNYAATLPGPHGPLVAFAAEVLISFVLMTGRLSGSQTRQLG